MCTSKLNSLILMDKHMIILLKQCPCPEIATALCEFKYFFPVTFWEIQALERKKPSTILYNWAPTNRGDMLILLCLGRL